MGGIGSGRRRRPGARETTDNRLTLDVNVLHSKGILSSWGESRVTWRSGSTVQGRMTIRADALRVTLAYRLCYPSEGAEGLLSLTWTPCRIGGTRPWFVCPECGRRAGKVYESAGRFSCRLCCGLVYKSQRRRRYSLIDDVIALERRLAKLRRPRGLRRGP